MEGIVNAKTIQLSNLKSLVNTKKFPTEAQELFNFIYNKLISVNDVQKGKSLDELSLPLLSGHTILYIDGVDTVLMIDTVGGEMRSIEEPVTETLIRGPREGFVENLQTNLSLIRRNIKDPNLRSEERRVGREWQSS